MSRMEQLWPGLLAEAWTALAADNGDQQPESPTLPRRSVVAPGRA